MLEPGTLLQGRYRIQSQIGKGGMGTVYVARDENIGMTVAVKRNFLEEPRLIEAFKREARLLAGLRHPALPQVKDYFIDATGQYIVMEYIAGDDLGTILHKRKQNIAPAGEAKPFEVEDVTRWAEQLLDALDYLHTRSEPVVHRDIKPLNLKLAERGQIILLDFGLAKGKPLWMTRATSTGSLYGYTPNYAPIEQIRGLGTDPRSDLYALGATLYHLITGESPIDAATRAESFLGAEPDPLPAANWLNPKVPKGLSSLLMKAMEPHRNNRPSSAAEMLNMLRTARNSTVIDWQTWQQGEAPQQEPADLVAPAEHPGDAHPTIRTARHRIMELPDVDEQAAQAKEELERIRRLEEELEAKQEAERKAREEAELKAKQEAERKAREEAELKAKQEAERKAREEAELKAKQEAERKAREEAELKAKQEAERKAREEAELKAKQEAERKAREEAERRAREEAERRRRQQYEEERVKREAAILRLQKELEEFDRKAREEAALKTKQEAERKAREEAELKAKQEAERKAREEAERKARELAELKAKEEAERKAREKADKKAREESDRRRREYEEARVKQLNEIVRLQKEQEELDRQEAERLTSQPGQDPKAAAKAEGRRPQGKSHKDEAIDKPQPRHPEELRAPTVELHTPAAALSTPATELRTPAVEQVQLWLQKLKPQVRRQHEIDTENQDEDTVMRLNKSRARRLYASIGVAALVLLILSVSILVLTSNKLRQPGSQGTDSETSLPALEPGRFETPTRVLEVALSDDGRVLASAGDETAVRVWRPGGSTELVGQSRKCRTTAVSRDGSVVASGTEDGTIRLWRATDGGILKTWRGHLNYVMSLSFSADGQTLFSTGGDRSLRLWRVSDGGSIADVRTSSNDLFVAVSTNPGLVGLNRQDGGVHLFYLSGDLLVAASDIKGTPVNCGEFSPDGAMIALGSAQGDVGLWRVSDGRPFKALGKFNTKIMSLTFSRNGQILAAGLADGAIKMWRVSDAKLIATHTGHTKSVNSLSFSADGRTLASGSDDKTVRIWKVEENQQ
jgi:hypothetical protein